ncbi:MAG: T9SS type A sorting domain-containing protein [Melioribacteraceae bacterium]
MKNVLLLFLATTILLAQTKMKNPAYEKSLAKETVRKHYSLFNIHNISTYIYNSGEADNKTTGRAGFVYPKGSEKTAVFQSGFIFGGKVNGEIKMNGSVYSSGMKPGRILEGGLTEDSESENARVFRVRPDYKVADLSNEINDGEGTEAEIRTQYEKDWNEWRASDGAPFEDINEDGIYNPLVDIPGVPGADQTLWFVTNDLTDATFDWNSKPTNLGVEIQTTIWGYKNNDILSNVLFKKYKIINKGSSSIDNMYIAQFSDVDIGRAGDFAGCDTLLNMGYCYNGGRYVDTYGFTPPAIGYDIVQGLLVEGDVNDKAIYNGKVLSGMKNLPLTSYVDFTCGGNIFPWPSGENQWYNYFQGKMPDSTSFKLPDEFGGSSTKFSHSGNPLTEEGWLDGSEYGCGERYLLLSSGSFTMAAGDTQEVVIAEIAAVGKDRLNSVRLLKYYSNVVQEEYDNFFNSPRPQVMTAPALQVTENDNNFLLHLDGYTEIQNYNRGGFKFQGFNLYQIYSDISFKENSIPLATFDIEDGIKEISGEVMDNDGSIISGVKYFGTDSGIPSQFEVTKDYITNSDLTERQNYYYGKSAYFYNPSFPEQTFETKLGTTEITYKNDVPGIRFRDFVKTFHSAGKAEASATVEVFDLTKLTDLDYTISFYKKKIDEKYQLVWNLDRSDGVKLLSEQIFSSRVPLMDGLKISVGGSTGLSWISDATFLNGTSVWLNTYSPIVRTYYTTVYKKLGYGTRDSSELFYNYEFRFTGERDSTIVNGQKIYITKENTGSVATVYNYKNPEDLKNHPLNPTGEAKRFTVRIPFEVWNVDKEIQVNYQIIKYFYGNTVWDERMYGDILDLPYNENIITEAMVDSTSNEFIGDKFTHRQIWDFVDWKKGDLVEMKYLDPITKDDVFIFNTKQFISEIELETVPTKFELFQNYPNPFNPTTTIRFSLIKKGLVKLSVFNILGERVKQLVNKEMNVGQYEVPFISNGLPSGIYFYRLEVGNDFSKVNKMILLK